MVNVIDELDLRMSRDRHRIEAAHLAHLHEGRLQLSKRLHVGDGRMCSSFARMVRPLMSLTGMMDLSKRPSSHARAARFWRLDRVSVDVIARKPVFGGDQIRRDALRQEVARDRNSGIDRPCAARGAHADAAHGFDAAPDGDVLHAGHHLRGREIDRIEARSAEAVDLHARNFLAEARLQHRRTGDIAAGFADGVDTAEHHVLDQSGSRSFRRRIASRVVDREITDVTSCRAPSGFPRPRGVRTASKI